MNDKFCVVKYWDGYDMSVCAANLTEHEAKAKMFELKNANQKIYVSYGIRSHSDIALKGTQYYQPHPARG